MYYQEINTGEIRKINSDKKIVKLGDLVYKKIPVFSIGERPERNRATINCWPTFKGLD